jgi:DNA-binding NtrC family response regulator
VRELDHTIERAVLMARGERIDPADLALHPQRGGSAGSSQGGSQSLDEMSLETVEAILSRKALARAGGNVSQAADALGLSRGALYRRIEKYGL